MAMNWRCSARPVSIPFARTEDAGWGAYLITDDGISVDALAGLQGIAGASASGLGEGCQDIITRLSLEGFVAGGTEVDARLEVAVLGGRVGSTLAVLLSVAMDDPGLSGSTEGESEKEGFELHGERVEWPWLQRVYGGDW